MQQAVPNTPDFGSPLLLRTRFKFQHSAVFGCTNIGHGKSFTMLIDVESIILRICRNVLFSDFLTNLLYKSIATHDSIKTEPAKRSGSDHVFYLLRSDINYNPKNYAARSAGLEMFFQIWSQTSLLYLGHFTLMLCNANSAQFE